METTLGVKLDENGGCHFSVWAPHAEAVFVVGDFNDWQDEANPMQAGDNGVWFTHIANAEVGHEYQYRLINGDKVLMRKDPYARQVTNSSGNAVIAVPPTKKANAEFTPPDLNRMVIYELHIGTFGKPEKGKEVATFRSSIAHLDDLKELGVNAIEVMPIHEFPGSLSWGYNPACPFAVESDYGTAQDFYDFVQAAHERGMAVILDVVYNHFGPSDLDLWQFDGWSENDKGGIYFYNDWRSTTPWGDSRPDYGRSEVRQYIIDNAKMWVEDFDVDGLRFDMSVFIRTVNGLDGDPGNTLADGWSLLQAINHELLSSRPRLITIAEDMQDSDALTKDSEHGGAGFRAQWDAFFMHTVRDALLQADDAKRDMQKVAAALTRCFNIDAFERVVYTESHDAVANGEARVPEEASPGSADSWIAKKKSLLGAGMVFSVPGIPMIFQGQEFLEDRWFEDTRKLDWAKADYHAGVLQAYKDLIALRLDKNGYSAGLSGQHIQVYHCHNEHKVVAFQRWLEGGAGDTTVVIANFSHQAHIGYAVGFPVEGEWFTRFNSNGSVYDESFDGLGTPNVCTQPDDVDGMPCFGLVDIAPYSVLILSQAPQA